MLQIVPVQGKIPENCYLFANEKTHHGWIIDPGAEPQTILRRLEQSRFIAEGILLTHGHFDHIGAIAALEKAFSRPVPVYLHAKGSRYISDPEWNLSERFGCPFTIGPGLPVGPGRPLQFFSSSVISLSDGALPLTILETPGHTEDSVTLYSREDHLAFVGDTIFAGGSYGNTSFPGGSLPVLLKSLQKILSLPDDTVLYSGHSQPTTVAEEKRYYDF